MINLISKIAAMTLTILIVILYSIELNSPFSAMARHVSPTGSLNKIAEGIEYPMNQDNFYSLLDMNSDIKYTPESSWIDLWLSGHGKVKLTIISRLPESRLDEKEMDSKETYVTLSKEGKLKEVSQSLTVSLDRNGAHWVVTPDMDAKEFAIARLNSYWDKKEVGGVVVTGEGVNHKIENPVKYSKIVTSYVIWYGWFILSGLALYFGHKMMWQWIKVALQSK